MKRYLLALLLLPTLAHATNWYVNPTTGGSRWSATNTTGKCNGLSPSAWVSGVNQNCPYSDFRYLWNDPSVSGNRAWVISGGDTVVVSGYEQSTGLKATVNGNSGGFCTGVSQCYMPTIPAGSSGTHTRILGVNASSCGSGSYLPDATKVEYLLSPDFVAWAINDTQYGEIQCLNTNGMGTSGVSGNLGIFTGNSGNPRNSANITLTNLTLQGFNNAGISGPIAGPYTVTDVDIYMNASSGWNFDDGSGDYSTGGSVVASYLAVRWSGCQQEWPITHAIPVTSGGCKDDAFAGYGDGIGTPPTILNFTLDHGKVEYNTQDGSDFAHVSNGNIVVTNTTYQGNEGGTLKVGPVASTVALNNTMVGNCLRMTEPITGAQTGFNTNIGDPCRAGGDQSGVNFMTTALYLGNAAASGTAVTGSDTHFDSQISIGDTVAPVEFPYTTYARTVTNVTDDLHLTVNTSFPTNFSSTHIVKIPGGVPSTSSTIVWDHNVNIGNGGTIWDGGCEFGLTANGGYASSPADNSYCSGGSFTYKNNIAVGVQDLNCTTGGNCSQSGNPQMWGNTPPTVQDYNSFWNINGIGGLCVGAHDTCAGSPLFVSMPALTIPTNGEAIYDAYNANLSSGSTLKTAGVTIGGQTTDQAGNAWASPPSMGVFQFAGTSTVADPTFSPVAGTYTGTQSVTISTVTSGATICYRTDGTNPAATTPGTCDAGSTTYSGAISVPTSITFKALATKAANTNSSVVTAAYVITAPSAPQFTITGTATFTNGTIP